MVRQILNWLIPIAILLLFAYWMLKKFGLAGEQSKIEKEIDEEVDSQMKEIVIAASDLKKTPAFDIYYYTKQGSIKGLNSVPVARQLAKELYDATDGFGTDEQAIFNVFSKLRSKAQVSQVAFEFSNASGENLVDVLLDEMDDADLARINNLVKQLPVNVE